MKVKPRTSPKKDKKKNSTSTLWHFLGGGILFDDKVKKWHPFIITLAIVAFTIVANQRYIKKKEKEVKTVENKYFKILDEVQERNIFLSPNEALAIEKEAKKRGFIYMDTNVYKMDLRNEE